MMKRVRWMALAWSSMATVAAAGESLADLLTLPVNGTQIVAPAQRRATDGAAQRAGSPTELALRVVGRFEGSRQLIVQENDGVESPSASRVIVIRDGLLDDSVRSERWDISLARTAAGAWEVREVRKAWRCRRGGQTDRFAADRCP